MNKLVAVAALVLVVAYFWSARDGFDPNDVRDKRVLVTGSSSGIGEHLAYEYSKLGARIMLTARRKELLEKVAQQCRVLGAREVHVFSADMGKQEDRVRLVAATEKALGGLDHLVLNHADIRLRRWKATPEDLVVLTETMNTNFVSFVDLTSRFLPSLKSEGHVAIVSSVAGKMAFIGGERYSASKHALHGFFSSWRQDLRHQGAGVSFTLCVLGAIDTDAAKDMITDDQIGVVTPQDTAVAIIRATTTRAREMYFGILASIIVDLHKFFPNFLEDKASDSLASLVPE